MAKITKATQTVTDLYSLRPLIIPEHKSRYFVMELSEMIEQLASQMLAWAARWKRRIYDSMRQAKINATKCTIPIWKMWEPDRPNEPVEK